MCAADFQMGQEKIYKVTVIVTEKERRRARGRASEREGVNMANANTWSIMMQAYGFPLHYFFKNFQYL